MIPTLLSCLLAASTVNAVVKVSVSPTVPNDASPSIDPAFPAFAFEERSFYYTAGPEGQANNFSRNLIETIGNRTNARPVVRVGGTSLQHSHYLSNQAEALVVPKKNQEATIPYNLKIGPSFFKSFLNFPTVMYVLDIPMGPSTQVDTSVAFAKDGYNTIGADNIISLELGNEPNDYGKAYTASKYASQFAEYSAAVSSALGIDINTSSWQIGSLSSGASKSLWAATNIFSDGIAQVDTRVRSFSAHYYQKQNTAKLDVAKELMNHNKIVKKTAPFKDDITFLSSKDPQIPFNFAETACGIGHLAGNSTILERSFGAALWQVDFMLYSMSIGVHRVHFQSGLGFQFSQWQPVDWKDTPAAVYANYYASVFAADFIGQCGVAQAVNIDLNDPHSSAYAMYVNSTLARVALVNLNYFDGSSDSSSSSSRGSTSFAVTVPSGVKSVTVSRFTSALGATALDSSDITWAGESWTLESEGVATLASSSVAASTIVTVEDGVATVEVADSEAVMVVFDNEAAAGECDVRVS